MSARPGDADQSSVAQRHDVLARDAEQAGSFSGREDRGHALIMRAMHHKRNRISNPAQHGRTVSPCAMTAWRPRTAWRHGPAGQTLARMAPSRAGVAQL